MLQHIHIRDLAIVSNLEVDLGPGMTALTGETGAGKSILVDALGFALGDRAESSMVRSGAERAEITAIFSLQQQPEAAQWLEQHELADGDECHLRRLLLQGGGSRAYINGTPVPLKQLQTLGDTLVDIHGQHAHHSLMQREHQRHLLDDFANALPLAAEVAQQYRDWQRSAAELDALTAKTKERSERMDLLQFQIGELKHLSLEEGELDRLETELKQLTNAEELMQSCRLVLDTLDDEDAGILHQLSRCSRELTPLHEIAAPIEECLSLLESAAIQLQEATSTLGSFNDALELDPARLTTVDQRLSEIHALARKFRCDPEFLLSRLQELEQEVQDLSQADNQLTQLEEQTERIRLAFFDSAGKLSKKRQRAALKLSEEVSESIHILGMADGRFEVKVTQLETEKISVNGIDQVEFLVSANPGHPAGPLAKIASGGELSRISLAIQVATIRCRQTPTLIFDEVDVGIGGAVAEIVGRMLRQLGENRQVLCVTHLPQVASQAHQHLYVEKTPINGNTESGLRQLNRSERIQEVARMLGGVEITNQTLAHAQEMIERSASAS